jgi:hypothetical protein
MLTKLFKRKYFYTRILAYSLHFTFVPKTLNRTKPINCVYFNVRKHFNNEIVFLVTYSYSVVHTYFGLIHDYMSMKMKDMSRYEHFRNKLVQEMEM